MSTVKLPYCNSFGKFLSFEYFKNVLHFVSWNEITDSKIWTWRNNWRWISRFSIFCVVDRRLSRLIAPETPISVRCFNRFLTTYHQTWLRIFNILCASAGKLSSNYLPQSYCLYIFKLLDVDFDRNWSHYRQILKTKDNFLLIKTFSTLLLINVEKSFFYYGSCLISRLLLYNNLHSHKIRQIFFSLDFIYFVLSITVMHWVHNNKYREVRNVFSPEHLMIS